MSTPSFTSKSVIALFFGLLASCDGSKAAAGNDGDAVAGASAQSSADAADEGPEALLPPPPETPGPPEDLPSSLWAGQWDCGECRFTIDRNAPEERRQKAELLWEMRRDVAREPVRPNNFRRATDYDAYLENLGEDGRFADLIELEEDDPGEAWTKGLQRLASLSRRFHWVRGEKRSDDADLKRRIFRGIAHYAKGEADNPGQSDSWHRPSFAMPSLAASLYFFFLPEMEAVERGEEPDALTGEVYTQLRRVALQAYTMSDRGDHTDDHPVSPERFRESARWVGANALNYRPIFQVAALFRSPEMMDTAAYVAAHALTPASHNMVESGEAFWNEGITADGLGWGHGRPNYTHYYPFHGIAGTSNGHGAVSIVGELREHGYPRTEEVNPKWVVRLARGSTWLSYKGWSSPMGRGRYTYQVQNNPASAHRSAGLARQILDVFGDSLTEAQAAEMRELAETGGILMDGYPAGHYTGARYFWNNDLWVKKTPDYYFAAAMASSRVDGVESYAWGSFDRLNLFNRDGHYVLLREGDEVNRHKGTWEPTALPGVTARFTPVAELTAKSNYRGFSGLHNFAGGVARGGDGAAGFIFEKDDDTLHPHDPEIYGVTARKGYFVFGRTVVCLGAGITDKRAELGGEVWTTVNHTAWRGELTYGRGARDGPEATVATGGSMEETFVPSVEDGPVWARQDGILYAVLPSQTEGGVKIRAGERETHWDRLANRDIPEEKPDTFEMRINHGEGPTDGRYGYLMYLGGETPGDYLSVPTVEVLHNTPGLQAVRGAGGTRVQAIFYDASAELDTGLWRMRVSHPAVVMAEIENGELVLTVSDPRQDPELGELDVLVELPVRGEAVSSGGAFRGITVPLPGKPMIGSPATVRVDLPE